jgi:hypothetical protein
LLELLTKLISDGVHEISVQTILEADDITEKKTMNFEPNWCKTLDNTTGNIDHADKNYLMANNNRVSEFCKEQPINSTDSYCAHGNVVIRWKRKQCKLGCLANRCDPRLNRIPYLDIVIPRLRFALWLTTRYKCVLIDWMSIFQSDDSQVDNSQRNRVFTSRSLALSYLIEVWLTCHIKYVDFDISILTRHPVPKSAINEQVRASLIHRVTFIDGVQGKLAIRRFWKEIA